MSAGTEIVDRVTGRRYEPTGEFRRPRIDEDYLDREATHVYSGTSTKPQIILRRVEGGQS